MDRFITYNHDNMNPNQSLSIIVDNKNTYTYTRWCAWYACTRAFCLNTFVCFTWNWTENCPQLSSWLRSWEQSDMLLMTLFLERYGKRELLYLSITRLAGHLCLSRLLTFMWEYECLYTPATKLCRIITQVIH